MDLKPPLHPTLSALPKLEPKESDLNNSWILAAVVGGVLVLYSLSRIINLQRRIRDLESKPPIDDIVMRGLIRHEVNEIVGELEQSLKAKEKRYSAPQEVHLTKEPEVVMKWPPIIVEEELDVAEVTEDVNDAVKVESPSEATPPRKLKKRSSSKTSLKVDQ